jgi:type III restriction enzyme
VKFRFEDQPHQAEAIAAVTDLFEAALHPPTDTLIGQAPGSAGHSGFILDHALLTDNLAAITEREKVNKQTSLELLSVEDLQGQERSFPNFSVEMETGTGKTYVYIATALRLADLYGLRKFVILVHSVAIRAGVVKTFEQTAEHFSTKFPSVKYRWGVLGQGPALDDFLEPSSTVQFLVASVQAIDKPDSNSVYQEAEQPQLWSESMSGIAGIAAVRPVVIVDEPQNMATELRRRAIATLNPLVVLRYSATHREVFNLVHRLGPKAASEAGLVKRVSVKGIVPGGSGTPYLMLKKLRSVRKRIMADVVMDQASKGGPKRVEVVLQNGSDLFEESEKLVGYEGMVVDRFERSPDRLYLENGIQVRIGEEIGVDRMAIWRDQIRHTIRHHLAREAQIDQTGRDIKVLSLFFVDRVADYVPTPDQQNPVLPEMFDGLFREEWKRAGRIEDQCPDPATLRVHYFPSTKTGIYKDTKGNASEAEFEVRAYEEIVANKELLLTKDNPRAFIFSHSALKEGWDNPNVFQVCFLRHTRSDLERRQQIGRGLRLPVDESGRRVADPATCRLTLVVDESFTDFRDGLNLEYAAAGLGNGNGGPAPDDADKELMVRRREDKFSSPEFTQLWSRIRYKARYRVTMNSAVLPEVVAQSEYLDRISDLAKRANVVQAAELVYDDNGQVITSDSVVSEARGEALTIAGQRLPDLVRLIEDQLLATKFPLQLTRPTIRDILAALPSKVKRRAIDDPDRWARLVAAAIRNVTVEEMVKHISYEPVPEAEWWDAEVVFIETETFNPPASSDADPSHGVTPAPAGGSNLFDHVIYDSYVERNFAALLENDDEHVRLFTKLPRRFRVRTPVGEYSPDWAIVYDEDGKTRLYLVRETKGTANIAELAWDEAMRIRFALRHFAVAPAGPVDFRLTTDSDGLQVPVRHQHRV